MVTRQAGLPQRKIRSEHEEANRRFLSHLRRAWRYLARKGRWPKNKAAIYLGLGDYLRARESWNADLAQLGHEVPGWGAVWRSTRLECESCDGYMVVRKRLDRRFKFAGCSNYTDEDCRWTLDSRTYARRKAEVCLALLAEQPSPWPFRRVQHARERISERSDRIHRSIP